ncbi:uncharacterized protein PSFLO_07359 [Pseudozyma flocculosa]|uniref:Uncharacterized protein n=1 Tax=Pseudozyma flocculosa TaxID=84751 RepID=A0A5C3FE13_9BASI|nr:uncharacterized protein PSFLO_07359 [Pseudozyma flocculosa]
MLDGVEASVRSVNGELKVSWKDGAAPPRSTRPSPPASAAASRRSLSRRPGEVARLSPIPMPPPRRDVRSDPTGYSSLEGLRSCVAGCGSFLPSTIRTSERQPEVSAKQVLRSDSEQGMPGEPTYRSADTMSEAAPMPVLPYVLRGRVGSSIYSMVRSKHRGDATDGLDLAARTRGGSMIEPRRIATCRYRYRSSCLPPASTVSPPVSLPTGTSGGIVSQDGDFSPSLFRLDFRPGFSLAVSSGTPTTDTSVDLLASTLDSARLSSIPRGGHREGAAGRIRRLRSPAAPLPMERTKDICLGPPARNYGKVADRPCRVSQGVDGPAGPGQRWVSCAVPCLGSRRARPTPA